LPPTAWNSRNAFLFKIIKYNYFPIQLQPNLTCKMLMSMSWWVWCNITFRIMMTMFTYLWHKICVNYMVSQILRSSRRFGLIDSFCVGFNGMKWNWKRWRSDALWGL
jgi:hypothetical protein